MTDGSRLPPNQQIVIALAFDSNYLAPASVVIHSCLDWHQGETLRFELVLDSSVQESDVGRLLAMCEPRGAVINVNRIDEERIRGMPIVDRFGTIVWARLFLPEILSDTSRVLYLDCDVLVLSDLEPLWEIDLKACPIGAVANVVEPAVREHVREMGIDPSGGFFNSGVLLLDLDGMRKLNSTAELVKFALSYGDDLLWPDQDALNVVFKGEWQSLHPRWNAQNSLWSWTDWASEVFGPLALQEAITSPAIRHFEGPTVAKPWHYMCPVPHRDEYLETLARTPWTGEPLIDRTAVTRFISLMPSRWRLDLYGRLVARRMAWIDKHGTR